MKIFYNSASEMGFREAFRSLKKKLERKKNINHKTSKKMEHKKWKTYKL